MRLLRNAEGMRLLHNGEGMRLSRNGEAVRLPRNAEGMRLLRNAEGVRLPARRKPDQGSTLFFGFYYGCGQAALCSSVFVRVLLPQKFLRCGTAAPGGHYHNERGRVRLR
ncbi:MAG: hypothetical protein R6V12_07925 [Candidatus Hydrogenedentota bacterium]